ncbi:hypothetical protein G6514_002319 [Epicoccum nigrum]|nr:hypothetical protein G6514_002319 [Epicoccum nigrum]
MKIVVTLENVRILQSRPNRAEAVQLGYQLLLSLQYADIFKDGSEDSNPSHSDIAKDHFSNLLNQPAGLVATVITNWTTRMVVHCWDDRNQNADEMIDYILTILHHPAFARDKNEPQGYMLQAVETLWNAHEEGQRVTMRDKLSKESARKYFEQHDHTIQASDFRGPNKRRYQHGFVFEGSQPELAPPPINPS